jgi:hypothetical protein
MTTIGHPTILSPNSIRNSPPHGEDSTHLVGHYIAFASASVRQFHRPGFAVTMPLTSTVNELKTAITELYDALFESFFISYIYLSLS